MIPFKMFIYMLNLYSFSCSMLLFVFCNPSFKAFD